jgi:aspartate-semialdehyde dehydrogenase
MKQKIPVSVLGATGAVGQRFVQLLSGHPWFEIAAVAASRRSCGRRYTDVCHLTLPFDPPANIADMIVRPLDTSLPGTLVFSALPAEIAKKVEPTFATSGYAVCSNASAFRYEPDVPLIIPEVNGGYLSLITRQRKTRNWPGFIITNPNCCTTGIALVLKPLHTAFVVERVFISTMQALSGAGYPGVASLDISDNVLPYIAGEEEKIEREIPLLLGDIIDEGQIEAKIEVSAHANRVPVVDGHTISLSIGFKKRPTPAAAADALRKFQAPGEMRGLPSAPRHTILLRTEQDRPQPRWDRAAEGGMAVTVGRIRPCPLLDLRLVLVVHNTIRGAAGGAILNGEALLKKGFIPKRGAI